MRSLSRREASDYLLEKWGLRRAPNTLAKQASIGGGPRYRKARKLAIYDPPDLDAYAAEIISEPAKTSAEHAASTKSAPEQPAPTEQPQP